MIENTWKWKKREQKGTRDKPENGEDRSDAGVVLLHEEYAFEDERGGDDHEVEHLQARSEEDLGQEEDLKQNLEQKNRYDCDADELGEVLEQLEHLVALLGQIGEQLEHANEQVGQYKQDYDQIHLWREEHVSQLLDLGHLGVVELV